MVGNHHAQGAVSLTNIKALHVDLIEMLDLCGRGARQRERREQCRQSCGVNDEDFCKHRVSFRLLRSSDPYENRNLPVSMRVGVFLQFCQPRHATDLKTGAIVGITVHDANEGDTTFRFSWITARSARAVATRQVNLVVESV